MNKKLTKALLGVAFMFIFTFGVSLFSVEEARADWYFSRTSISKCNISLERYAYEWTGREVRPRVIVEHEGKRLREGEDFEVEYRDNINATKDACIKVKGINNYRSTEKVYFEIIGIDISRECTFTVRNGNIQMYYKDRLVPKNNYTVTSYKDSKREVGREPSHDRKKEYIIYEVRCVYTIRGCGQYYGECEIDEIVIEKELVNRPEPGHDGPGHGGGNHPGPGGPGHGGGNHPGPGGPGHGRP